MTYQFVCILEDFRGRKLGQDQAAQALGTTQKERKKTEKRWTNLKDKTEALLLLWAFFPSLSPNVASLTSIRMYSPWVFED